MRNANGNRLATVMLLVMPLMIYLLFYLYPLLTVASQSVDNSTLYEQFQTLSEVVEEGSPDERAAALVADLVAADRRDLAEAARNLNQERSGFRSLLINSGKKAEEIPPTMEGLIAFDKRWGQQVYWDILARNIAPITWRHFQKASGFKPDGDGGFVQAEGDDIYLRIMVRTIVIATQVTLLTLLVGYPLAYAAANGKPRLATIVFMVVLLSFWTSILVRTSAWVVLLQTHGLLNNLLISLRIISEPLQLIFNRFGTVVAMTHVLLPFAILPIFNVMRTIPVSQSDASRSLGAGGVETFLRVYFPQTLRGVAVGGGTVFILALGFYITPALTGGPSDQMLSYYIADFVKKSLNWGMASVLSVMLFGCVVLILGLGSGAWLLFKSRKGGH
ncbi:ABC transporter permease [Pseudorhodobacter aquimaris]|uniref:ABC transporter permease n=1 Tax=Pseudorhodobacter aquimaris TaxID=687412 RepID=UPI00067AC578|nr:ABC transporter permease [Pseudorhodobacter aquimaris]